MGTRLEEIHPCRWTLSHWEAPYDGFRATWRMGQCTVGHTAPWLVRLRGSSCGEGNALSQFAGQPQIRQSCVRPPLRMSCEVLLHYVLWLFSHLENRERVLLTGSGGLFNGMYQGPGPCPAHVNTVNDPPHYSCLLWLPFLSAARVPLWAVSLSSCHCGCDTAEFRSLLF